MQDHYRKEHEGGAPGAFDPDRYTYVATGRHHDRHQMLVECNKAIPKFLKARKQATHSQKELMVLNCRGTTCGCDECETLSNILGD